MHGRGSTTAGTGPGVKRSTTPTMRVAILDYGAGNLASVRRAFAHLGADAVVTADPTEIAAADRVVFPGVGAAASCMTALRSTGTDAALRAALAGGRPVLGICLGLQLLFESSEEDGGTACLGILPGKVVKFQPTDSHIKVPHMGWNPTKLSDPILGRNLPPDSLFYYVHSYHVVPGPGVQVVAVSDHGQTFCAGVRRDNLVAMQFHPEKSGPAGLQLLADFIA